MGHVEKLCLTIRVWDKGRKEGLEGRKEERNKGREGERKEGYINYIMVGAFVTD